MPTIELELVDEASVAAELRQVMEHVVEACDRIDELACSTRHGEPSREVVWLFDGFTREALDNLRLGVEQVIEIRSKVLGIECEQELLSAVKGRGEGRCDV